jgi:hypothetical protein
MLRLLTFAQSAVSLVGLSVASAQAGCRTPTNCHPAYRAPVFVSTPASCSVIVVSAAHVG